MSAEAIAIPEPKKRVVPAEINNILTFWWLMLAFGGLAIASLWPIAFANSATNFPGLLLSVVLTGLLLLGIFGHYGFVNTTSWSISLMRLTTLLFLGLGIALIVWFFVANGPVGGGKSTVLGPSDLFFLPVALLTLMLVLPFIFGMMVIFGLMHESVERWYNPPLEEEEQHGMSVADPVMAMAMSMGAGAAAASSVASGRSRRGDEDDLSVEVVGSADDVAEEVVEEDAGTEEELAALEEALTDQAKPKGKAKQDVTTAYSDDEPLKVDDDMKL